MSNQNMRDFDAYENDDINSTVLDVREITEIIEDDRQGETLFLDNFVDRLDEILRTRDITVLDFSQCETTDTSDFFIDKIEQHYSDMEIKRKNKFYSLAFDYIENKYGDKYQILRLKDIFNECDIKSKNVISSDYLKVFQYITGKVKQDETFILDIRIQSYETSSVATLLLLSKLQVIFQERLIVEGFTDYAKKDVAQYFKARALTVRPNLYSFETAKRWHKLITPNNSVVAMLDVEEFEKASGKRPISQISKIAYVCSVTNLGIVVREISKVNLQSSLTIDRELFKSNTLIRYDDIIQLNKIVIPIAWCNEYKQILKVIEDTKDKGETGLYSQFKKNNLTMKNVPLTSFLTTKNYSNCYDIMNNKISNQDFADYVNQEDLEQTEILNKYIKEVEAVFKA